MPLAGPPDTPPKSTASFLAVGPSPCSVREARTRRSREQPSSWGAHFRTVDSVMAFRTRRGMAAGRCRQKVPRTFPGQQRGQWPPQAPWRLGEALWAGRWTGWSDYRGRETQIPRYRTLPKRAVKPPEHRRTHRGDATALRVQAPSGRAPRHARTVGDVTAPLSRTDRTQTRTVGRPQARSTGPAAVTLPPRGGGGVRCAVRARRALVTAGRADRRSRDTLKVVGSRQPSSLPEMSANQTSIQYFRKISTYL